MDEPKMVTLEVRMPEDWPLRKAQHLTLGGLALKLAQLGVQSDDGPPTSMGYLRMMVDHALQYNPVWPIDKTNRWIGYVQGVLAARGLLDVTAERNTTREFFHEAYREMGIAPPASVALGQWTP